MSRPGYRPAQLRPGEGSLPSWPGQRRGDRRPRRDLRTRLRREPVVPPDPIGPNASRAQYCRNTLTGLPNAAAPAVRTAAACSLSSVPEKRTRFNGSSMTSPRDGMRSAWTTRPSGRRSASRRSSTARMTPQATITSGSLRRYRTSRPSRSASTTPAARSRARCCETFGWVAPISAASRPTSVGPCARVKDLKPPRVRERLQDLGLQVRDLLHIPDYRHMRRLLMSAGCRVVREPKVYGVTIEMSSSIADALMVVRMSGGVERGAAARTSSSRSSSGRISR